MHEQLTAADAGTGHIDIARDILDQDEIPVLTEPLTTSFPVRDEHLAGEDRPSAVDEASARRQIERFRALACTPLPGVTVNWEEDHPGPHHLFGTAALANGRQQPFSLQFGWLGGHLVVRAVSPIGLVSQGRVRAGLLASTRDLPIRVGVVEGRGKTYDVTIEEDVLLTDPTFDAERVGALIDRVVSRADPLEQQHLPDRDRLLDEFRKELQDDVRHR
jgi:hypothetical protein